MCTVGKEVVARQHSRVVHGQCQGGMRNVPNHSLTTVWDGVDT
jgi:hypothetical protein